jgi:hypothetical protein
MTNIVTNADGSVTVTTVVKHIAIGPELWIPAAVVLAALAITGWWFLSRKSHADSN